MSIGRWEKERYVKHRTQLLEKDGKRIDLYATKTTFDAKLEKKKKEGWVEV